MRASGAVSPSLIWKLTGTHNRTIFLIFSVSNLLCNLTEAFKLPALDLSSTLCAWFHLGKNGAVQSRGSAHSDYVVALGAVGKLWAGQQRG